MAHQSDTSLDGVYSNKDYITNSTHCDEITQSNSSDAGLLHHRAMTISSYPGHQQPIFVDNWMNKYCDEIKNRPNVDYSDGYVADEMDQKPLLPLIDWRAKHRPTSGQFNCSNESLPADETSPVQAGITDHVSEDKRQHICRFHARYPEMTTSQLAGYCTNMWSMHVTPTSVEGIIANCSKNRQHLPTTNSTDIYDKETNLDISCALKGAVVTLEEAQEALGKVIAYLEAHSPCHDDDIKILAKIMDNLCSSQSQQEDNEKPILHNRACSLSPNNECIGGVQTLDNDFKVHNKSLNDEPEPLVYMEKRKQKICATKNQTTHKNRSKNKKNEISFQRIIHERIKEIETNKPEQVAPPNLPQADSDCGNTIEKFDIVENMGEMKRTAQNNIDSVYAERPHVCEICNKGFKKKKDLTRHIRIHTGERPFKCTICEKAFADRSTRNSHLRIHTGEKPYECHICHKAFTDSGTRNAHVKVHTGEKSHACVVCNKMFAHAGHLKAHTMIHTNEKPYQCTICEKSFRDRSTLRQHTRLHTGVRPYHCKICGKNFAHSSNYQTHQRAHSGDPSHKCTVCDAAFVWSSQLSRHMITHSGTGVKHYKYKCTECDKVFFQSCNLQAHIRIHTGEKPYQCSICGKVFNHSGSLTVHMRTHTGERPYKCDICRKEFSHAISLQTHKRIHTGEKPYVCSTCGKGFAQSGTFRRHTRLHTGEKPYECTTCGDRFNVKGNLVKHMKVHGVGTWLQRSTDEMRQMMRWDGDSGKHIDEKRNFVVEPTEKSVASGVDVEQVPLLDNSRYFRVDQDWASFK